MCSACRAKQASRKAEADSEKGKKRDKDGGRMRANGEDGSEEKKRTVTKKASYPSTP